MIWKLNHIESNEIKNLITRFEYKENAIIYKVLLHLGVNKILFYHEYRDFAAYQAAIDALLRSKKEGATIFLKNCNV